MRGLGLATVCEEASCPNISECFEKGAATFLILGKVCTRGCAFCGVAKGRPGPPDPGEPERVASGVKKLGLKYVVVTSVTRDDLPDEGAGHFAAVIRALREHCGAELVVEVLVPDFHAREECVRAVVAARPNVFNHNLETVERLYPSVRPQGDYRRALQVLEAAKRLAPALTTKSGLMVGLGETQDEVHAALRDLRAAGCDIVTIGQYLQPSKAHVPVREFVPPDVFKSYETYALGLGFSAAACGPFVRSSYQADRVFQHAQH